VVKKKKEEGVSERVNNKARVPREGGWMKGCITYLMASQF